MSASRPAAKVVVHYGNQFSVFSGRDRYCENRLFWSHDPSVAKSFARAFGAWVGKGCPLDGSRPLSASADGVYRQRDVGAGA